MSNILPFLINFDGVINLYDEPAPYSKEFFDYILNNKLLALVLSNSSLKTSMDVRNFLLMNNLPGGIPIMTAADSALNYVKNNYKRVSVYCVENVKKNLNNSLTMKILKQ